MAKALTVKRVENERAGPQRREIPDGRLIGLYLVVQPSGQKSFAVRYRSAGRTRKFTLGTYPAIELAQARSLGAAALRLVAQGGDPAAEKKLNAAGTDLVVNLLPLFIERYAKPRAKAKNRPDLWRETGRILGLRPDPAAPDKLIEAGGDVLPRWRGRRVQDITKRDVIALIDDICDRGARIMANRTLAALRTFFGWCVSRDILQISPCTGIRAPAEENGRDRVLNEVELRLIWRASLQLGYPFASIVQLLLLTGQRLNEITRMRWTEVDLNKAAVCFPADRVKNTTVHEIPLPTAALDILRSVPRIETPAKFIFASARGKPPSGFSHAKENLDRAVTAANRGKAIPHWTFHDLRRSMASGMARIGVDLHVIEKILNHKSGTFRGVVGVYQRHDFTMEKREALERYSRQITVPKTDGASAAVLNFYLAVDENRSEDENLHALAALMKNDLPDEVRSGFLDMLDPALRGKRSDWCLRLVRVGRGRPKDCTQLHQHELDALREYMARLVDDEEIPVKEAVHRASRKFGVERTTCLDALNFERALRSDLTQPVHPN
jgi:integrase